MLIDLKHLSTQSSQLFRDGNSEHEAAIDRRDMQFSCIDIATIQIGDHSESLLGRSGP